MKAFIVFCLICLTISCSSTKETISNTGELNGSWLPMNQEIDGQELPIESFEGQRLAIVNNSFLFVAESADAGSLTYSNGKMDIYVETGVNEGKHFPAIYKFENNLLTICYNLAGDSYPQAFETKSNPNFFLSVFRKE